MCGIFGYLGKEVDAAKIVLEGLKRLEYRGYDSWGIATLKRSKKGNVLAVQKKTGKISDVTHLKNFGKSTLAIGHSRWATHGEVTNLNAHPHWDTAKKIALIHNGILENYTEIKKELIKKGVQFITETDTEVAVQLIGEYVKLGMDLKKAAQKAAARFEGRFAFVLFGIDSDRIIAVRSGAPLIIGISRDATFIASDIPAFLPFTNTVNYLDDGEMVEITQKKVSFFSIITGKSIKKRLITIEWKMEDAVKGDFEHYMLKEIFEQKETILRAVQQDLPEIQALSQLIQKAKGVFFIGCGTAGKIAQIGTYFFASVAKRHINFTPASEFRLFHHFLKPETLIMAISQSGETADVIEALDVGRKSGSTLSALVNVQGSTIHRMCDSSLLIRAGVEKAVASTKAATSQMSLLLLLAYAAVGKTEEGQKLLGETASKINDLLNPRYLKHIAKTAKRYKNSPDIFIIGRGANFPLALEAAIKIQEVSYIHAEGFAGGELKHGPIALIQKGTPCVVLVGDDESRKEILSNAMELRARGAKIIGVSPKNEEVFDEWFRVPESGVASPIVNLIPIQLFAYSLAVAKGLDPDMPRNLAKSVTVK
ncbi:glutamine--fructose-6-phosphate transaminase (isomerizing) [Candidatus Peregrinibacteria bacterium]|nr:glutamine--fructose-6-phosphate transaminase (isomerizing) [Candidatus Peregrinibacteria bacterium]